MKTYSGKKKRNRTEARSAVYVNGPRLRHDRPDKKTGISQDIPDKRRRAELNRCMRVLQTRPLPLGYDAVYDYIKTGVFCPVLKQSL